MIKEFLPQSCIKINKINLWSHVGVLDHERKSGQSFLLDLTIWVDLNASSKSDDLNESLDYSNVINKIQQFSYDINCKTIEHFSEKILDLLEMLYGKLPIQITLTKCTPPIDGFTGNVSIVRCRNLDLN